MNAYLSIRGSHDSIRDSHDNAPHKLHQAVKAVMPYVVNREVIRSSLREMRPDQHVQNDALVAYASGLAA